MMVHHIKVVFYAILLIFAACKSDKDTAQTKMETAHGNAAMQGAVTYQAPAEWIKERPASSMRKDQYQLPGYDGAGSAELGVFVFPGSGGAVQANINRWLNQFKQPDGSSSEEKATISKISNNGLQSTLVYVTGTYLKGAMGGPMSGATEELPGYAMLAAIVETSSDPWFFKAVGPQQTIDHWQDTFKSFIKTVSEK
jgi:hypothetical protein